MRPANLARRPFRNERLPNLLFALAVLAVVVITVRHAFVVRALLPGRTSALHDEVMRLEEEAAQLRSEQASLRGVAPEPKALARWLVVKDLVDRRAFSWTNLFARLEERIPDGARLVSIAPRVNRGEILLDVQAVVRSPEVGWQFMRTLEEGGDFDDVFPLSEGAAGEFHYTMRYRPRPEAAAADAPTAVSSSPPSEGSPPSIPVGARAGAVPAEHAPEVRP
jgi:Tfp pilus assembly protein PilN